ncbi:DUF2231 domain-containing protein [Sphingomonas sp. Root241]|uniref:DUF2231 domain-containing protein n=1 Tax=Sphingomonas sp. Root241 TaxID=1736501 RepID=UPI0006FACC35|nr:DUF2231 domain-containing protein [Sphingomonas sp. Root241]KRC82208.1 hypothetical protein ASE13_07800 [Sphingomonas sp. Root241]
MDASNPRSTAKIAGHPIHPMLIPFPIAFFVGTLAVDIAYSQTGDPFWTTAGRWLLIAGLIMAALAALAGLTDFLGDRRIRALSAAWHHMIGNVIVVLLEVFNLGQRLGQGDGFVVPMGMILSVVVTLLLLYNGWRGWEMVYRGRVGVTDS